MASPKKAIKNKRAAPRDVPTLASVIVDTALSLGGNLDSLSMPVLAKSAGLAIGTLYRIAPSKEALAALIAAQAQERFNQQVFAPFPARLDIKSRFELIFERLVGFAANHPDCARFLAQRPFGAETAYGRAAAVFAADGAASGMMRALDGPEMVALTWGPVASLILSDSFSDTRAQNLKAALWRAFAA